MASRQWRWTFSAALLAAAFLLLRVFSARIGALPSCSFRSLTGLYCPGCGGTRCVKSLLRGDIAGAFALNAVTTGLFLIGVGLLVAAVLRERQGRAAAMPRLPDWFAWCLVGSVVAFGLLRNLPWWPFTLLAPH
jgi:hypothetical protein